MVAMRLLVVGLLLPIAFGAQAAAPAATPMRVPDDVQLVRDVVYGKVGDRELKLDILRPKAAATAPGAPQAPDAPQAPGAPVAPDAPVAPMPVIVYVHGGGWESGNKADALWQLIPFAQKGYFCVTVDYRLIGEAAWPAQIEDCKCAVRFLRAKAAEFNIDPQHVGAWGASAGGHLVALMGTAADAKELEGKGGWADQSSRVQAVCDWFGPTDLTVIASQSAGGLLSQRGNPVEHLLGGPPADLPEKARQASPITYVTPDAPPFLIMHGDKDTLVPMAQSELLRDALAKAKVEAKLEVVKGAGHGFGSPELTKLVMDFFDSHLKPKPADAGARAAE